MRRRSRSEPLRYQVRRRILELLANDNYRPGDKIPTENEFMDILDVSRSTLREGLHLLEEERILRSKHGSGRYLVSHPQDLTIDLTELESITKMMERARIQTTTRVLEVIEKPAEGQVMDRLDIEHGAPVVSIARIRYANETPVIYSVDILARHLLPSRIEPDLLQGSIMGLLEERMDVYLDHSHVILSAVLIDETLANRIGVNPYLPWFLLEQTNCNYQGTPVMYSKDYHRTDNFKFHIMRYRR